MSQETTTPTSVTEDVFNKVFIHWHEGTNEYEGKEFTTIKGFEFILSRIYKPGLGYTKVKIDLHINDGEVHTLRIDVGDSAGDYLPGRDTLKSYFLEVYKSNLIESPAEVEEAPAEKPQATPVGDLEGVKKALADQAHLVYGETGLSPIDLLKKLREAKESMVKAQAILDSMKEMVDKL